MARFSYAYAINDQGEVVGQAQLHDGSRLGFRVPGGSNGMQFMLGARDARAINNAGQIVGNFATHAFRTAPNSPFDPATDDLGTLGGTSSFGYGINAIGQVVGTSQISAPVRPPYHAFRTAPNAPINPATDDLGSLGGANSDAYAINLSGQVVGKSDVPGDTGIPGFTAHHAFRTAPNSPINPLTDDLGTLGGFDSEAYAINSAGHVVGFSNLALSGSHAFLFDGTRMLDLNDLIPPDSGWELIVAQGINDAGQIVGYGEHKYYGTHRAFLLTPIPEPGTLALLGSAGLALGLLAWARRRHHERQDRRV